MNLWQEMFNQPVPCEFTAAEWNEAWNWLVSDKETVSLKLTVARRHSLALRRLGHVRTAEMAVCGMKSRLDDKSVPNEALGCRMPVRNHAPI